MIKIGEIMVQQVLVIHGGNAYENYDNYIQHLKDKELSLEKLRAEGWKNTLQKALGDDYEVFTPFMPNPTNARYLEWKILLEKYISLMDNGLILVGHSLGAITIAKYLSENNSPRIIKATFLVAAPYNTKEIHPLVDFNIETDLNNFAKQSKNIFIYHSTDDEIVPFSNCKDYQKRLPKATVRIFEDRGHFHQSDFPELVEDIKNL